MFNSFQKPSTSLSQYESSIDTSNIIPQNQALKQIKKALLGCGLLNTFDINKANGDHTGTKFSRSLNTRPINTVTIKNLSESVKQHSLYSLDVDKCLHMFCKRSDINLETLSPNWENLKPIKFSPSAKNIKLANGSTGSIIWNCSGNHISKGLFKHLENNVRLWVSGVWSSMTWIRYGLEISGSIFILFYFVYRHAEQWWYPPGEATQPLRQGVALSKCVSAHPQG